MRSSEVADLVLGFLSNGNFGDEPENRIDTIAAACSETEDDRGPATP
jgi:hypothetical protein